MLRTLCVCCKIITCESVRLCIIQKTVIGCVFAHCDASCSVCCEIYNPVHMYMRVVASCWSGEIACCCTVVEVVYEQWPSF